MSFKTYLVGGAVRDRLLGRPVTELDWVVVGATPEYLIGAKFKPVGKDFPVFLHPETHEEYALARTERKVAPGYHGFECHFSPEVTLEEDLLRRDLTINAIAEDKDGKLIDPFNGQQDIKNRILRHVSPAFQEDPLRILRIARFMARFASLGFSIATETQTLMQDMVKGGELATLVPERVWREMRKALEEERPSAFFETLRACGGLEILWPELNRLWGVPQPARWHPEIDTGVHVMMALEKIASKSQDPCLRFAVLCHDLGKGLTPAEKLPSHPGHEAESAKLVENFCRQYKLPNEYRDLAVKVARYHTHCHKAAELKSSTLLKTLEALDAFRKPLVLEQFLQACEADAQGRLGLETATYPQTDIFREAYQAAKAVQVQELLAQGLSGQHLKEKLHQARVLAIDQSRKS